MAQGDNAPDFYGVTNVVGSCTGIPLSLIFLRLQTERETGAFLGCNKPLNTPLDCTGSVKNCVQHAKQAAISRMFPTHYYWPQSENFEFMNAPLWAIEELSWSTKPFDLQCRTPRAELVDSNPAINTGCGVRDKASTSSKPAA